MPKLLILSAEEKSHRRIKDDQTITVDGGAGSVSLN